MGDQLAEYLRDLSDPMVPRHRLNGCRSILKDRFKIQSSLVENYQCLTPEKALNHADAARRIWSTRRVPDRQPSDHLDLEGGGKAAGQREVEIPLENSVRGPLGRSPGDRTPTRC